MGRSSRRHHRQRMVRRAETVCLWRGLPREEAGRQAARLADNMRSCSCWLCKRGEPIDKGPTCDDDWYYDDDYDTD